MERNYDEHLALKKPIHPQIKRLAGKIGKLNYQIPKWDSIHDAVVYSVIGQMLSNPASRSIIQNLLTIHLTSENIIKWCTENSDQKGALNGLSQRKRRALASWHYYIKANGETYKNWPGMQLSTIRKEISGIWGFGRWSADMISIFYLGRPDIWPETDTGIKRTAELIFRTADHAAIKNYVRGNETITALYLWEILNRKLLSQFKNG